MEKEKIVVLAYTGTGKTEMTKRYEGIWNPSSDDYRYIFDKSLSPEQRKSDPNRIENPEFPNNFINAISEKLGEYMVVLVLTPKLFPLYESKEFKDKISGARIIMACPSKDNFGEYEERFKARGNSETFIGNRRKEFPFVMDIFEDAQGYEKVNIEPGQYLDEALVKHGLNLAFVNFFDDSNITLRDDLTEFFERGNNLLAKCPNCEHEYSTYIKTGRLGCSECYNIFRAQIIRQIDNAKYGAAMAL